MRKLQTLLVAGAVTAAVVVPAATSFASQNRASGTRPADAVCTYDQQRDMDQTRLQLHDGTGAAAAVDSSGTTTVTGFAHQSGPQDGTGPRADPALDGTGNQWRAGVNR